LRKVAWNQTQPTKPLPLLRSRPGGVHGDKLIWPRPSVILEFSPMSVKDVSLHPKTGQCIRILVKSKLVAKMLIQNTFKNPQKINTNDIRSRIILDLNINHLIESPRRLNKK